MKKFSKLLSVLILALFVAITFVGCGGGDKAPAGQSGGEVEKQVIELKIGSGHPTAGMAYTSAAQEFFQPEITKRVLEATDGKIEIKWIEAYGGTVAKLAEVLEATESGLLDVGVMSYPFDPTKLYLMNMPYYIPFQTTDAVLATKVTRMVYDKFEDVYEKLFTQYNQKFLGFAPAGDYELLTTFPVNKLEDIKGKKIAAAGPNLTLLEGTGAVPVQSNLNEAYTSYQTGVYEGWIMYANSSYGFKLHEVSPYHTNVGFGVSTISGIHVNLDTWNTFPKEVQDVFVEVGKEYELVAAQKAADDDANALKMMAQEGATISDLPQAEKDKWAAVIPNVPQKAAEEAESMGYPGKEIFRSYIEFLEAEGYVFPRKWTIE